MAGIIANYTTDIELINNSEQPIFPKTTNQITNSRTVELIANKPFDVSIKLLNNGDPVTTVTVFRVLAKAFGDNTTSPILLADTGDNNLTGSATGDYIAHILKDKLDETLATSFDSVPDGSIAIYFEFGDGVDTVQVFDRINVFDENFDGTGNTIPVNNDTLRLSTGGTVKGNFGLGTGAVVPAVSLSDTVSTTKGVLPYPAMTEVQRDAITPVLRLTVFNTDSNQPEMWDGSSWVSLVTAGSSATGRIDLSAGGDPLEVDWALGDTFFKSIAVNETFTFINIVQGQTIYLDITGSAGAVLTLPATTIAMYGTPWVTDVRNFIEIKAVNGATEQTTVVRNA